MPIELHVEDWMKHLISDIQTSKLTAFIRNKQDPWSGLGPLNICDAIISNLQQHRTYMHLKCYISF